MGTAQSRKVGEHYTFYTGECSFIGKRKYNEDHVIVKIDLPPKGKKKLEGENPSLFAVCDGHSGARCSEYLRSSLPDFIRSHSKYGEKDAWEEVLVDSFRQCDEKFLRSAKKKKMKDGSTCVLVIIHGTLCVCANVGDSRGIMISKSQEAENPFTPLSSDHKPDVPSEKQRIIKHGGTVKNGRIHGDKLSVSRSFGDLSFKNQETLGESLVSAVPDVRTFDITEETHMIILACDGIWDVFSNKQVTEFIHKESEFDEIIADGLNPSEENYELCNRLAEQAEEKGSTDNLSVIMIGFDHNRRKSGEDGSKKDLGRSRKDRSASSKNVDSSKDLSDSRKDVDSRKE